MSNLREPWATHGLATTLHYCVYTWIFIGIVLACLNSTIPRLQDRLASGTVLRNIGLFLAIVLTGMYLAMISLTTSFPGYVDPCEPLVVAASYFATHGVFVYNTTIAYGPYCFLPFSLMMHLFGNSLITLKMALLIGNLLLLTLLFVLFRRQLTTSKTLVVIASLLGSFLLNQTYILQIRGDLFIYIAVTLALISVTLETSWLSSLLMASATGLAVGVKSTAILYLIYPLVLLWKQFGTRTLLRVAALSALISLAPFGLPMLSLKDYLRWLQQMSHEPRSDKELLGNLVVAAVLLSPAVLTFGEFALRCRSAALSYARTRVTPFAALLVSMFVTIVLSAKFGAGRHHLTPFAIIIAFFTVDVYRAMQTTVLEIHASELKIIYLWGCLGVLLVIAEASELQQVNNTAQEERSQAISLTRDVNQILDGHPNTQIELGYGRGTFNMDHHYSEIYAAPQLIFHGNSYPLDLSAEADRELMKLPLNQTEYQSLAGCKATIWLIPRGEEPFLTESIYSGMYPVIYPNHYLFPEAFRRTFKDAYVRVESSNLFDLYECRPSR